MTDFNDGYDEVLLDHRTDEDEVKDRLAQLKLKYPNPDVLAKTKEVRLIRERLTLIRGKLEATLLLDRYVK